jgi:hypothetical protein
MPTNTRKPQGRPARYGTPQTRLGVFLPPALAQAARDLGDGNVSAGIRLAVAAFTTIRRAGLDAALRTCNDMELYSLACSRVIFTDRLAAHHDFLLNPMTLSTDRLVRICSAPVQELLDYCASPDD